MQINDLPPGKDGAVAYQLDLDRYEWKDLRGAFYAVSSVCLLRGRPITDKQKAILRNLLQVDARKTTVTINADYASALAVAGLLSIGAELTINTERVRGCESLVRQILQGVGVEPVVIPDVLPENFS